MAHPASRFGAQKANWSLLRGLTPRALDLSRVELVRGAPLERLREELFLQRLIERVGLNDEAVHEFPAHLLRWCGSGLLVWQYPSQFAGYLALLSTLNVRSYVELGIRHGGSFVLTAEYLRRFAPLDFAIGIDILPWPSALDYAALNPAARFWRINTQCRDFASALDKLGAIDLTFIDSHHEHDQCWNEFAAVANVSNMIALHDICNDACPGVVHVWDRIKRLDDYVCFEWTQQYGQSSHMGIGLAVKRGRLDRSGPVPGASP